MRILLVHWNVEEAQQRAEQLRAQGLTIECYARHSPEAWRLLSENPPDAFVVDLSRSPSMGREIALALRRRKSTRTVPIVIAGGDPKKIERLRQQLPDAVYSEWPQAANAIRGALANPPINPVVPAAYMDAYSGRPLVKKLGITAGSVTALLGAPEDFESKLAGLPERARLTRQARGAQLLLLFVNSQADLERRISAAMRAMGESGRLWIIWPKKGSALASDLTEKTVRATGLAAGLVDFKICAVDDTWSGLLFTRRRAARR